MERDINNNTSGKPFCCKMGCIKDATVNVVFGSGLEDFAQSCNAHIVDVSGDFKELTVTKIE